MSYSSYHQNDQTIPISIPIQFSPNPNPTPIPTHYPLSTLTAAATKIQSHYRSHLIRTLTHKLQSIDSQATRYQLLIQRQETVDSVRSSEIERTRLNEQLMGLLLRLDSVPGQFDSNVRELRRRVSRRIVGLQEIVDGIAEERIEFVEGVPRSWEELVEKIWGGEEREEVWGNCTCSGLRSVKSLEEFVRGL